MKGYYIVPDFSDREKGIIKKINFHIELFSKFSSIEKIVIPNNKWKTRILYRLPIGCTGNNYLQSINKINNPDYIYIRKGNIDRKLIKFLENLRIHYPKCKILFEVPTYPYEKDALAKLHNYFILLKDRYYRQYLKNYVDRIITYSNDDEIFGIKTIKAHNGIDYNSISPISDFSIKEKEIRLIGVAQFRPQHGYERLIKGLGAFYTVNSDITVTLTLVGNGSEISMYKREVERNKIDKYVIFAGSQDGDELDKLYNSSDIAISSLGMYKLGLEYVSTLKNCEYLAKGLPIIVGYDDYVLHDNIFCLRVENNDRPIDIQKIIKFYKSIYVHGKKEVVKSIRSLAYEKVDISQSYREVISYLLEK